MGMDLVLICLEYTNNCVGKASIKPMIYAIKLKLEFTIHKSAFEHGDRGAHGEPPPSWGRNL